MIGGFLGFIAAAFLVSLFGGSPARLATAGWWPALIYAAVFGLMHRRIVRRVLASPVRIRRLRWMPLLHLAGFALVLVAGWAEWVSRGLESDATFLLGDAWLILPWLVVYASWTWSRGRIENARGGAHWPLPSYLAFHFRILVIPAVPVLLIAGSNHLVRDPGSPGLVAACFPSLFYGSFFVATVLVVVFSPWLVRLAVPTRAMTDGPLRRRFEELAERASFRFLDIRVCETHGHVVNAAFVGLLGRLRYVIMTDGILARLNDDDLVGVFAHEMGHSVRRHIVFNMMMMLGFSMLMNLLASRTVALAPSSEILPFAPLLALPVFILFVFSPVARSFETEADVYAGEILGDPGPISRSLGAVGRMSPDRIDKGGLIHPSINDRVAFLQRFFDEPAAQAAFARRSRRIRLAIAGFATVTVSLFATALPDEIREGGTRMDIYRAVSDDDRVAALAALERLDSLESEHRFEDSGMMLHMSLWQIIATDYQDRGRLSESGVFVALMDAHREAFERPLEVYNASIIIAQQAAATGDWPGLRRELEAVSERLDELADRFGEDDEQIRRERIEIAFLNQGLHLIAARGSPSDEARAGTPEALPEGPEYAALRALQRHRQEPRSTTTAALPRPDLSEVELAWRAAFIERLIDAIRGASTPAVRH